MRFIKMLLLCAVVTLLMVSKNVFANDLQQVSARALKFDNLILTGQTIDEQNWLANDVREDRYLNAFGGYNDASKHLGSETKMKGGLKSAKIINIIKAGNFFVTDVEIQFGNHEKGVDREYWKMEDGLWKVTNLPRQRSGQGADQLRN